jgi:hypothetical protein
LWETCMASTKTCWPCEQAAAVAVAGGAASGAVWQAAHYFGLSLAGLSPAVACWSVL